MSREASWEGGCPNQSVEPVCHWDLSPTSARGRGQFCRTKFWFSGTGHYLQVGSQNCNEMSDSSWYPKIPRWGGKSSPTYRTGSETSIVGVRRGIWQNSPGLLQCVAYEEQGGKEEGCGTFGCWVATWSLLDRSSIWAAPSLKGKLEMDCLLESWFTEYIKKCRKRQQSPTPGCC